MNYHKHYHNVSDQNNILYLGFLWCLVFVKTCFYHILELYKEYVFDVEKAY